MIALIGRRLTLIRESFARLVARIAAETYKPRRPAAAPRRAPVGPPRKPDLLPKTAGWFLKYLPEARQCRGQLENLLQDPEMAALMAAAPAAMRRPIRSLCRMLGAEPPAILALPPRAPPSPGSARPRRPATPRKPTAQNWPEPVIPKYWGPPRPILA
jgi:hypothetical protein